MLRQEYGQVGELNVVRGKKHEYLGIDFDFSGPGKVVISMIPYLEGIIAEAPSDMDRTAISPAANHLFKVRDEPKQLNSNTSELFHHIVAQLLFVCK